MPVFTACPRARRGGGEGRIGGKRGGGEERGGEERGRGGKGRGNRYVSL